MKIIGGYAFSESEVRAIAAGKKTRFTAKAWEIKDHKRVPSPWQQAQPGDVAWVQEAFVYWKDPKGQNDSWGFRADFRDRGGFPPSPSYKHRCGVHTALELPRDKSRYTLEIVSAVLQTPGDMTDGELEAEGIHQAMDGSRSGYAMCGEMMWHAQTPREAFLAFLKGTRGRTAYFDNTPIAGLTFKLHLKNVNQLVKAKQT